MTGSKSFPVARVSVRYGSDRSTRLPTGQKVVESLPFTALEGDPVSVGFKPQQPDLDPDILCRRSVLPREEAERVVCEDTRP